METIQLYKKNTYEKKFRATVVACEIVSDGYKIVLDQTAFFPEGGGQYGDQGYLDQVEVIDTQIKDGIIFHKTREPLSIGSEVEGKLNWERRYDFMQNHSAEHLICGLIHRTYGYDNVGFHLGETEMTFDVNGILSMEQLLILEKEVNEIIWQNRLIQESYPTKEEEEQIEYRSKKEVEGELRLITIEGVDCCACCAPHVAMTGEIGIAKVVSVQKNKSGVRITMLAGKRALDDYQKKHRQTVEVCQMLSIQSDQIIDTIKKLQEEKQNLTYEQLQMKLQLLQKEAEQLVPENGILCMETDELEAKEVRELCNYLMTKAEIGVVLNKKEGKEEVQYSIGSQTIDVRQIVGVLREKLEGRGGGTSQMIQRTVKGTKEEVIQEIHRLGDE